MKKTFIKIEEEALQKIVSSIDNLKLAEGQNFRNSAILSSIANLFNSAVVFEEEQIESVAIEDQRD
jgi:hypothetical protein